MKKFAAMMFAAMLVLSANLAHAFVFIDFEPPTVTPDATDGDFNHNFLTTAGVLTFNGNVSNTFNGNPLADVTTGSGYFFRDSSANNTIEFNLGFEANAATFYLYGDPSTLYAVAGYDDLDNFLGLFSAGTLDDQWLFYDSRDYVPADVAPHVTKVRVYSLGNTGAHFALDDITVYPVDTTITNIVPTAGVVPEPASMLLLGSGLVGLLRTRRTK